MRRRQIAIWIIAALLLLAAAALAGVAVSRSLELPPSDGPSLTTILQSVEKKDLGAIQSVEYEREWWQIRGSWEVTVCRESCFKLYIDARTGTETRRKSDDSKDQVPPANVRSPAAITRSFEEGKLGVITEIEFQHGAWQVKFRDPRGLLGALKPTERRVFEPVKSSWSRDPAVPRTAPPAPMIPRMPAAPSRNRLIPVGTFY